MEWLFLDRIYIATTVHCISEINIIGSFWLLLCDSYDKNEILKSPSEKFIVSLNKMANAPVKFLKNCEWLLLAMFKSQM